MADSDCTLTPDISVNSFRSAPDGRALRNCHEGLDLLKGGGLLSGSQMSTWNPNDNFGKTEEACEYLNVA